GVTLALLSGLQRQHMHRFGAKAVARPGDEAGVDPVSANRDAVAEVGERSLRTDLGGRAVAFPIIFGFHGLAPVLWIASKALQAAKAARATPARGASLRA